MLGKHFMRFFIGNNMESFGEKKEKINYISRPGAYIIFFNSKKEIGVIQTPKGLFLPGGGKNKNESDEECLKRELLEELGWNIVIGKFLGNSIQYFRSKSKFYKADCNFYLGKDFLKVSDPIEEDHILKWFSFEHLSKNLHIENQKWAINEAIKYKKKERI